MAAPTNKWRTFPLNTADTAVDTPAKRLASIASESAVSTAGGEELDFGTVDISGGANQSLVHWLIFDCDNNQSNSTMSDFRLYAINWGFTLGNTALKFVCVCDPDTDTPSNCDDDYQTGATVSTYNGVGWNTATEESVPTAQNSYPADDSTTIDITTLGTTDDAIMWGLHLHVEDNEQPGTYLGTTSGYEFQIGMRYTYS